MRSSRLARINLFQTARKSLGLRYGVGKQLVCDWRDRRPKTRLHGLVVQGHSGRHIAFGKNEKARELGILHQMEGEACQPSRRYLHDHSNARLVAMARKCSSSQGGNLSPQQLHGSLLMRVGATSIVMALTSVLPSRNRDRDADCNKATGALYPCSPVVLLRPRPKSVQARAKGRRPDDQRDGGAKNDPGDYNGTTIHAEMMGKRCFERNPHSMRSISA